MNLESNFTGWEDPTTTEDFFSILQEQESNSIEDTIEEKENEVITEEDNDKISINDDDQIDLFSQTTVQETDESLEIEEESDENEEEIDNQSGSIQALQYLKSIGKVDFELEEGTELDNDLADNLIQDGIDKVVEESISDMMGNLPEALKQINRFVLDGGDFNEIISHMQNSNQGINTDMDIEDEKNQELFLTTALLNEGYESDEISAQIAYFKDSGDLAKIAKKRFARFTQEQKKQKEALLQEQRERAKVQKESQRQAKRTASDFINTNEGIGYIKFNRDHKRNLSSYMVDKTERLDNGNYISKLQKALYIDLPKNEKAMMQISVLLQNMNEDGTFNFDSIVETGNTELTRKIKKGVRRTNDTSKPFVSKNSKRKTRQKALADYF